MAVMEVSLPSGYVMDEDSLPSLRAIKDVKKVETKEGGTGISLYFDKVTTRYLLRNKTFINLSFIIQSDDEAYRLSYHFGLSRLQSG